MKKYGELVTVKLLNEAVKQPGLACRHAALRVGEFEVATSGGIWVAIRAFISRTGFHQFLRDPL